MLTGGGNAPLFVKLDEELQVRDVVGTVQGVVRICRPLLLHFEVELGQLELVLPVRYRVLPKKARHVRVDER